MKIGNFENRFGTGPLFQKNEILVKIKLFSGKLIPQKYHVLVQIFVMVEINISRAHRKEKKTLPLLDYGN